MSPVCACILAAGMSTRMGRSKQLLDWHGGYLLEHIIGKLLRHDFQQVYAVIGHEAEMIQERITISDPRFHWIINEEYAKGQSTSVKCALDQGILQHKAVAIFLGDLPFLKEQTIQNILSEGKKRSLSADGPFVIQPSYQGTPGHPVYFGNLTKESYADLDGDQGMKAIIRSMKSRFLLPVEDEGIFLDLDTPEAYEQLKNTFPN